MLTTDDLDGLAVYAMSRLTPHERGCLEEADADHPQANMIPMLSSFFLPKYAQEEGVNLRTQQRKDTAAQIFADLWKQESQP